MKPNSSQVEKHLSTSSMLHDFVVRTVQQTVKTDKHIIQTHYTIVEARLPGCLTTSESGVVARVGGGTSAESGTPSRNSTQLFTTTHQGSSCSSLLSRVYNKMAVPVPVALAMLTRSVLLYYVSPKSPSWLTYRGTQDFINPIKGHEVASE